MNKMNYSNAIIPFNPTDDYIVAYFDVLGIKEMWKKGSQDVLKKLWIVNHRIMKDSYNEEFIIKPFSDNFLIALKLKDNFAEAFNKIGNLIGGIYLQLLKPYGILLRGAIATGKMCIDGDIFIGDALIKAYELESNIAIYPRIIVDENIIKRNDFMITHNSLKDPVFQDFDLRWCLNPLILEKEYMEKEYNSDLANFLMSELVNAKNNERVKSKINWLINYVNLYYYTNYNQILVSTN